jgi:photosystem II stability/assembly factor-like uncharacterized protein
MNTTTERRSARWPRLLAVMPALAMVSLAASATADQGLADAGAPTWHEVTSPAPGPFRAVVAVSRKVAWVGSDTGELWRTMDGGATWLNMAPKGSTGQSFRRIILAGDRRMLLFARGGVDLNGPNEPDLGAHIYRSTDFGETWHLEFANRDPAAYYDCMDMFADGRHGLALGDPVNGRFRILATSDGGRTWQVHAGTGMPKAIPGEYGFATGTCLETSGNQHAWFGTGFAAARIFHTGDGGETWSVTRSTLASDAAHAGGVLTLGVRGLTHVLAAGGSFRDPDLGVQASGVTVDGRTWTAGGGTGGLRTSVAWVPGLPGTAIAGGLNGTDRTTDGGRTWVTFSALPLEAVDCAFDGTCWGVGADGTVARLVLG